MGRGGRGGRSSGRSYGGGSGANMGAVAGAWRRLFRSAPASLSSSGSIDYSKWDEEEIKWLKKYSKDSRCRMAASYLDACEEIRSPGHPRCNKYREVLADCPGGEKGTRRLECTPAPLSSSKPIDYSKWEEDEIKWLYKYSKESRCRMALSHLNVCEEIRPGHSKCNRFREVLADCPGRERGFGKR